MLTIKKVWRERGRGRALPLSGLEALALVGATRNVDVSAGGRVVPGGALKAEVNQASRLRSGEIRG